MDNVIILDAISNSTNDLNSNINQTNINVTNAVELATDIKNKVNAISNTIFYIPTASESSNLIKSYSAGSNKTVDIYILFSGNYRVRI